MIQWRIDPCRPFEELRECYLVENMKEMILSKNQSAYMGKSVNKVAH